MFDFTLVHERMAAILNFCLLDTHICLMSDFPMFSIAYSSILIALEHLEWESFSDDLRSFISDTESGLAHNLFNALFLEHIDEHIWKLLLDVSEVCLV